MDWRIIKAYENQENSTVDSYMLREMHTPRPVLDKTTVLNVAKEKFSKMTEDLAYYSTTRGNTEGRIEQWWYTRWHFPKIAHETTRLRFQSNAIKMEINKAILMKRQPHSATFIDVLASLEGIPS